MPREKSPSTPTVRKRAPRKSVAKPKAEIESVTRFVGPEHRAALIALAFHAWSGAAEALEEGSSARAVAVEFGALAVLGVVVALLLTRSCSPHTSEKPHPTSQCSATPGCRSSSRSTRSSR